MSFILHFGDCVETLRHMPDNSADCCVTDPPYELGFMGKKWDNTGIAYSVAFWCEVLRVLKPGGHLLSFSGSRTYHRMTCAIEDAGFEIRDQIMWIYGSGFPKSLDVSKAIDKAAGAERAIVGKQTAGTTDRTYGDFSGEVTSNKPITAAAADWQGWGTALKPAHEPICVARKPLIGTVIKNVLEYGTGAINIDGCRVGTDEMSSGGSLPDIRNNNYENSAGKERLATEEIIKIGRFPANVIHDGSEEVTALFPFGKSGSLSASQQINGGFKGAKNCYGSAEKGGEGEYSANEGSAARFFYCAKASKADRGEGNTHPTVKPQALMRYLVRLVCPPAGVCIDPFNGSGSTGKATIAEGFRYVGMERETDYVRITCDRNPEAVVMIDGEVVPREIFDMIY